MGVYLSKAEIQELVDERVARNAELAALRSVADAARAVCDGTEPSPDDAILGRPIRMLVSQGRLLALAGALGKLGEEE